MSSVNAVAARGAELHGRDDHTQHSDEDAPSSVPGACAGTQGHRSRRKALVLTGLAALLVAVALMTLVIGRSTVPPVEIVRMLAGHVVDIRRTWYPEEETIILNVRLPRMLLAVVIGAGLAIAGAAMQAVFSNPLASSDMVGVSAGASFGGVLSLLLGLGSVALIASSFIGGILALVIVLAIARATKGSPLLVIILAGLVVGAMFNAFVSLITYVADPYEELPSIVFWLMGSLSAADYPRLLTATVPIALGSAIIIALRWRLNILSLGETDARALGIDPRGTRLAVLGAVALVTAGAVAVGGVIGWVGLVIPHFARLVARDHDNRLVVPASALLGASYLMLIDTASRTVIAAELPLGILTAVVGAPVFVALLVANSDRIGVRS